MVRGRPKAAADTTVSKEEQAMGLDQRGSPAFCVMPGRSGQWDVKEEGFEKSLASFDEQEDALEYARDLAGTKEGSTVKVFDQQGKQVRAN